MSTTTPIQLIVGLGNPGEKYAATRHNAGVWLIEKLVQHYQVHLTKDNKLHGSIGKLQLDHHLCRLLIPHTYMNESGRAVQAAADYYKIAPQAILIVHDELDLPAGITRLKFAGGHGGHNGLRDIIEKPNTKDFCRLRIGIDKPKHKEQVIDYVLHSPSKQESLIIQDSIATALDTLPYWLSGELEKAMQALHTIKVN